MKGYKNQFKYLSEGAGTKCTRTDSSIDNLRGCGGN